jgi:hypothetical protein
MKNILSIIFLVLTALLSFTTAKAQHDFRPGYIVTYANDTIKGEIDYAPMKINSIMCNFRRDPTKPVKVYSTVDLIGYTFINGKRCLSKNVEINDIWARHFLECLIIGDINLYYLKNKGHDYYFIEQSSKIYELKNEYIAYIHEGVTYSRESEEYKNILLAVLPDTLELSDKISRTYYNHKSLCELIIHYHELINKPTDYWMYTVPENKVKRKKEKVKK